MTQMIFKDGLVTTIVGEALYNLAGSSLRPEYYLKSSSGLEKRLRKADKGCCGFTESHPNQGPFYCFKRLLTTEHALT